MSENTNKPLLKAVIFDMDGLMFDSERIVQLSWHKAGDRLGYPRLGDNIYHTLGMNAARRKTYFQEVYGKSFPFETFRTYSREAFDREVTSHGLPVKTGLTELLTFLKASRIRIAVATSSSQEYALGNLHRANVFSYLDGFVAGNMVSHGKPHPEIYRRACETLKISPEHALALEDAPNGIRSAHAAGLHPILIPDLIEDSSSIEGLFEAKLPTLRDVIPYIKEHFTLPE